MNFGVDLYQEEKCCQIHPIMKMAIFSDLFNKFYTFVNYFGVNSTI
jgi:hypothetical protein